MKNWGTGKTRELEKFNSLPVQHFSFGHDDVAKLLTINEKYSELMRDKK